MRASTPVVVAVAGAALAAGAAWAVWDHAASSSDAAAVAPVVVRFAESLAARRFDEAASCAVPEFRSDAPDASLRPLLDQMDAVLGRRTAWGEARAARAAGGGSRIDVARTATFERGAAVFDVALVRGEGGPWLVSNCSVRAAAFTWVLR